MKAGIASIRKELNGIYPREETESMIALIFEKLRGYSRARLLLSENEILSPKENRKISQIVARLKNQEPIQYILGTTEFYGLPFYAVPGVLIPRPETEELVHWIIQDCKTNKPAILDIGTGTGCIAVSLAKNIPESEVLACDISPVCLETACRNSGLNNCNVSVFEFDILKNLPETAIPELDVVVSNPPYVRESERAQMQKNVLDFEPELALFVSDDDPLLFYERIAEFAKLKLKPGGHLYFEINEALGKECSEMLAAKGFSGIILKKDLNGKDRMLRAAAKRQQ